MTRRPADAHEAAPAPEPPHPPVVVPHAIIATIDAAEFDLGFRGYRPAQVHAILDQVRGEVVEMSVAYGQARREAEASRLRAQRTVEAAPPPPPPEPPRAAAPVSAQVTAVLEQARQLVDEQFQGAAERADRLVADAERAAGELEAEARRRADELLAEARREAEQVTARARTEQAEAVGHQRALHATLHQALDAMSALRAALPAPPDAAGAQAPERADAPQPWGRGS